jgi:hypothetical protein
MCKCEGRRSIRRNLVQLRKAGGEKEEEEKEKKKYERIRRK